MQIRFQADYDFNKKIVRAMRHHHPTIDFRAGHDAGLEGLPDNQVLEISARDGRILVSHDVNTMPVHFANFIASQNSPGLNPDSSKTANQTRYRGTCPDLGRVEGRRVCQFNHLAPASIM
jgi:hypothetical protein